MIRVDARRVSTLVALVVAATAAAACTPSPSPTSTRPVTPPPVSPGAATSTQLFPLLYEVESTMVDDSTSLYPMSRIGFLDSSWQVVVEPVYSTYLPCPGPDGTEVMLAVRSDGTADAFDAQGTKTGSTEATYVSCALPGYVVVTARVPGTAWDWTSRTVRLPDLADSDLPIGLVLDTETLYVSENEGLTRYLYDVSTSTKIRLPTDLGDINPTQAERAQASGEWPVPAPSAEAGFRYLDRDGRWLTPQAFDMAWPFVDGFSAVMTDDYSSAHFVDTNIVRTGPSYSSIYLMYDYASPSPLVDVLGYRVASARGGEHTGIVARDLTVLVDPATETAECGPEHLCVATAADGSTRLLLLPEGAQHPLPESFTKALSEYLVTDEAGTRVHNLATGQTFDVPAPYAAVSGHADAFVSCESPNGLRMVLDATGARTDLGVIGRTVTALDGTPYFWAVAGNKHGYVDSDGRWMYSETRYTVMED
ncbi:MAG: WG repeat-containing protein [Micrococcales bacterium]|nr:WG repeat-containing protein [Micrococcales bacterium]